MNYYKSLYKYLLPSIFNIQENAGLFMWIPILGDVVKIKRRAIDYLKLQKGDKVLVYSIGAGFELDLILKHIGKDGYVVGVDFSKEMLDLAQRKINKNKWNNVKLVLADVRQYKPQKNYFDAALSNFGYLDKSVLSEVIAALKLGGQFAISTPQPLRGLQKIFYPVTFVPEMLFGLTWNSLKEKPKLINILKSELKNTLIDENTFAKYFVAVVGKK